jgi:hypothetical protein
MNSVSAIIGVTHLRDAFVFVAKVRSTLDSRTVSDL